MMGKPTDHVNPGFDFSENRKVTYLDKYVEIKFPEGVNGEEFAKAVKKEEIFKMRSKLDHETPEVGSKNMSQYKKGITHESMKPGDADKGRRPKEESNTGGSSD